MTYFALIKVSIDKQVSCCSWGRWKFHMKKNIT